MALTQMQAARKAISLFANPHIEKSTQRHNQRQWLSAIGFLGDKWILAKPVSPIKRRRKPARRVFAS